MNQDNSKIRKRGDIRISQLMAGCLVFNVIALFGYQALSQTTAAPTGARTEDTTVKNPKVALGQLKEWMPKFAETWLRICHAYSDAWQTAINDQYPTAENAISSVQNSPSYNGYISMIDTQLGTIKALASWVEKSGDDIQRTLASDCLGTMYELAELAKQPRGTLFSFNNTVEQLESRITKLKGQLSLY